MACSYCNCSPCSCNTANCPQCECVDPGSVAYGRYLPVLDYAFCDKRLAAPDSASVLIAKVSTEGQQSIEWSNTLFLNPGQTELVEGTLFPFIGAYMGSGTAYELRALYPANAANGFLQASNGQWVLADLPTASIPDPLTVATINATTLGAFNNVTVGGTFTFTNSVPTGTIATSIGLDSTGKVVKETSGGGGGGGLPQYAVAKAVFYEIASEESYVPQPNVLLASGAYVTIGNEIVDPNGIASVTNATTIEVDVDGYYEIQWIAFTPHNSSNSSSVRGLFLEIDGTTSIPSSFPAGYTTGTSSDNEDYTCVGMTVQELGAGAVLRLRVSGDAGAVNNFIGVKLVITRFQGT